MNARVKRADFIDGPESFAEAFNVPHETIHSLTLYAERLAHWQESINLVAPSTLPAVWSRHFADSAQLRDLAPEGRLWLDLGSGAGFPGLVVAILQQGVPGFHMHLVESNAKKCAFLREVARVTEAPVDIQAVRIEDLAEKAQSLKPDVVSARALAPLPRLLGYAAPFMGEGTIGLFMKGQDAHSEVAAAKAQWALDCTMHPSVTEANADIVNVRHLRARAQ